MKCIECKRLNQIANTDETRQGICTYPMSYTPVCVDNECIFIPKELTCKDCDRFENDFACMTAQEDDLVMKDYGMCGGFIDKGESEVYNILAQWVLRGVNAEEKLKEILDDFSENFEIPFQPIDKTEK